MVLNKIREALSRNDEKYEVLYHKYSHIKLENKRLREQHEADIQKYKEQIQFKMANHLIDLYVDIENTKNDSFKVKATDKDTQRLLISLNKVDKDMKDIMTQFAIETYSADERFYDPEMHDIASYQDANGMKKGIIMKTLKKGFKYKNLVIKKPKVVVTK